jgi:branched-chain amino acid transport system ATP-binding protein
MLEQRPALAAVEESVSLLTVTDLVVAYGDLVVVSGATLEAKSGEVTALVGPNGAGKTTLLMALAGLMKAKSGTVVLDGENIVSKSTRGRMSAGLILVPQGRELFGPMTVLENLRLGAFDRPPRAELAVRLEYVLSLFPDLEQKLDKQAGTLSGGQQQMVAIGRAVMGRPRFLLLDEPSLGLAPLLVRDVFQRLRKMADSGIAVIVVEQEADAALRVADTAIVMRVGRVSDRRPAQELRDPSVLFSLYFGE